MVNDIICVQSPVSYHVVVCTHGAVVVASRCGFCETIYMVIQLRNRVAFISAYSWIWNTESVGESKQNKQVYMETVYKTSNTLDKNCRQNIYCLDCIHYENCDCI